MITNDKIEHIKQKEPEMEKPQPKIVSMITRKAKKQFKVPDHKVERNLPDS